MQPGLEPLIGREPKPSCLSGGEGAAGLTRVDLGAKKKSGTISSI